MQKAWEPSRMQWLVWVWLIKLQSPATWFFLHYFRFYFVFPTPAFQRKYYSLLWQNVNHSPLAMKIIKIRSKLGSLSLRTGLSRLFDRQKKKWHIVQNTEYGRAYSTCCMSLLKLPKGMPGTVLYVYLAQGVPFFGEDLKHLHNKDHAKNLPLHSRARGINFDFPASSEI